MKLNELESLCLDCGEALVENLSEMESAGVIEQQTAEGIQTKVFAWERLLLEMSHLGFVDFTLGIRPPLFAKSFPTGTVLIRGGLS